MFSAPPNMFKRDLIRIPGDSFRDYIFYVDSFKVKRFGKVYN